MVREKKTLYSVLGLVAIASACSSSANDDSAGSAGTSSGGAAAGHGGSGNAGGGHANGGSANGGTHAGGSGSNQAGASSGGNAGSGINAGGGDHAGGTSSGGNAGAEAVGGEAGAAMGGTSGETGEAGSANGGAPGTPNDLLETAYVAGFLGGIYTYSLDPVSGVPTAQGSAVDPHAFISTLAVDPAQRFLYVLDQHGTLDTFAIGKDGSLPATPTFSTPLAGVPLTLALDPSGRFAYVGITAKTGSTTETENAITMFALNHDTGEPSPSGTPLPLTSGPAYLALSPNGKFAYLTLAIEAGLWAYRVDQTTGALEAIAGAPFGGDAVFKGVIAFTPNGAFMYTTGSKLTDTGAGLNGFKIDADGTPERIGTELLQSDEFSEPFAKNIALDASGKHLYVSQFLGNGRMFEFSIDSVSGKLTPLTVPEVSLIDPYSCAFDPSNRFLYVAQDTTSLSVYDPNASTGILEPIDGSPFALSVAEPILAFSTRPNGAN